MQSLRNASFLVRLVLAWFALSLGVAVASPLVNPVGMQLVCSTGGAIKLIAPSDDGGQPVAGHTLDCPLCISIDAPPVAKQGLSDAALPPAAAVSSIPSGRIALLAGAPLPARGPPAR